MRRVAEEFGDAAGMLVLDGTRTWLLLAASHAVDAFGVRLVQRLGERPLPAGQGVAGRVLQEGRPVVLVAGTPPRQPATAGTTALADSAPEDAWLAEAGISGLAAIPVRAGAETLGVLEIMRVGDDRGPFGPEDIELLDELVTDGFLLATLRDRLERAGSDSPSRREAARADTVGSFFAEVAFARTRQQVYEVLVKHAERALSAEVMVYARTPEREHVELVAARPEGGEVVRLARRGPGRRIRVGEATVGRVAASGRPTYRPGQRDETLDPPSVRMPPELARVVGDRIPPASIASPIHVQGEVEAVIYIARPATDRRPFDPRDFTFVQALAVPAAVALEAADARRLAELAAERERIRAEVLHAATLAGDDEHAMFTALVERLAELGGYASIQQLTEDGSHVVVRAHAVHDPDLRPALARLPAGPLSAGTGGMGEVLRTGEPVFLPRAVGEGGFLREAHGWSAAGRLRGLIAVPFRVGGRIAGVIGVAHVQTGFRGYEDADRDLLVGLGASVTIMLEHAAARRARDQAAAEQRRTAATLGAVLDASPLAIIAVGTDNRVTFWSRAAERLYGFSRAEALDRLPPHFPRDPGGYLAEEWERLRAGEERLRVETQRRHRDGTLIDVVIHAVALRDPGGAISGIMTVQEDVTEQRRLEAELAQAQKLETIGKLAGGVAHDFNNILTAIIGFADLTEQTTREPGTAEALQSIRTSAQRAAALTQQLLAFSRRQMMRPAVVDLNEVVREVESLLRRLIGENVELTVSTRAAAGAALVDRTQLEQVILNLAVNARDAMPAGGRLVIGTDVAAFEEDSPHVAMGRGEYVVLSVTDTGVGMDEATRARVFEPFFTTKDVGKGTGLGLATVYGIVRQSGGHVWVYSEPGLGTTFRIYLPRAAGEPLEPGEPRPRTERRAEGVVLFVEDEPLLRELGAAILGREGFRVHKAATPSEALAVAHHLPRVDALVSDVIMPGFTGVELARQLRVSHPELPVVLMSGYEEDVTDAASVADRFVAKPFTPATLAGAVRGVVRPYAGPERRQQRERRRDRAVRG